MQEEIWAQLQKDLEQLVIEQGKNCFPSLHHPIVEKIIESDFLRKEANLTPKEIATLKKTWDGLNNQLQQIGASPIQLTTKKELIAATNSLINAIINQGF